MDSSRVLKLRKRLGWGQVQMARALGVAQYVTISHWETGFREPKGITERFLCYLECLSEPELKKAARYLDALSKVEKHAKK